MTKSNATTLSRFRWTLPALLLALLSISSCRATSRSAHDSGNPYSESTVAANKALGRIWFEEVINRRNLDAIDEHYAKDYVHHGAEGAELRGVEAARGFAATILAASNDRIAVVEQQVAEGDLVVTRFVSRGTHTGTFRGVEPTGKEWTTEGICISRIENGKIAEDWEIIHVSGLGPEAPDAKTRATAPPSS